MQNVNQDTKSGAQVEIISRCDINAALDNPQAYAEGGLVVCAASPIDVLADWDHAQAFRCNCARNDPFAGPPAWRCAASSNPGDGAMHIPRWLSAPRQCVIFTGSASPSAGHDRQGGVRSAVGSVAMLSRRTDFRPVSASAPSHLDKGDCNATA